MKTDSHHAAVEEAAAIAARVHAAFERVWRQRMAGLPFVHENMQVELVGLRPWRAMWLGVLVTPWFMNLLLLPGAPRAAPVAGEAAAPWPSLAAGETAPFDFPAGRLHFIAGREAEAGEYLACSLFSPMFEFVDHDSARQTALACLAALFDAAAPQATPPVADALSKRDFLRGRWQGEAAAATGR